MKTLIIRVAGVQYDNRQDSIMRLMGDEPLRIIPEPENPHDSNALAVYAGVDGAQLHVGYIPRETAAEIAPFLEGESYDVESFEVLNGRRGWGLRVCVQLPDGLTLNSVDEKNS